MDETLTEMERALGLRDSKHRHREAKKHELPMGSGDQPNLEPKRDRIFPIKETNRTKIQLLYKRLFERVGVGRPKGKSSHLLRSTHATLIHLAGGDATKSLGHSSREVTRRHYLDPRFKPDDSCEHLPSLDD